ncbi:hypothetical protein [Hyphomicrobium sp. MC1]|uniref:hypothetical protein n=1 Tax=Hyphomicrobium sp. (strain MC1) TaxID=717785 RepID=UPI000213EFDC|nr:hypothetical protein [Hyphomicrobium sp. MC1]CCB66681.1 protein of unknown function [Hyphomicrobium sp. MC1]
MNGTKPPDSVSSGPQRAGWQRESQQPTTAPDELQHAATRLDTLLTRGAKSSAPPTTRGRAGEASQSNDSNLNGAESTSSTVSAGAERLLAFLGGGTRAKADEHNADKSHIEARAEGNNPQSGGELGRLGPDRREDKEHGGGGEHDRDDGKGTPVDPSMLAGCATQMADPTITPLDGQQPDQLQPRSAEIAELVDKIAERVLVGQRADGQTEIRVTMRSDLLGGSEVRIARGDSGLELHIDATSDAALRTVQERGDELVQSLADRLDSRVTLQLADQRRAGDEGQRQRSAGYDDILSYVAERR